MCTEYSIASSACYVEVTHQKDQILMMHSRIGLSSYMTQEACVQLTDDFILV